MCSIVTLLIIKSKKYTLTENLIDVYLGLSLIPTLALAYPFLSPRLRQANGQLALAGRQGREQPDLIDPTQIRLPDI